MRVLPAIAAVAGLLVWFGFHEAGPHARRDSSREEVDPTVTITLK